MTTQELQLVTKVAMKGGQLLSERRNLIARLVALSHNHGHCSWADVMSIVLEAEHGTERFYDISGALRPGLTSLHR